MEGERGEINACEGKKKGLKSHFGRKVMPAGSGKMDTICIK